MAGCGHGDSGVTPKSGSGGEAFRGEGRKRKRGGEGESSEGHDDTFNGSGCRVYDPTFKEYLIPSGWTR